ncbi:PP2C family protein-serine/threonine phosphatase [Cellulomonas palmilytica]|uniref:PP2C family protein-serine/threonine phosphatase n=1 Tax=Cellulomonas palmilytica TaxID=2608402 RepID=UPI001F3F7E8D|nr:protein phosphatase 2C domain-containing protein [Cellulomonas palmilytica]
MSGTTSAATCAGCGGALHADDRFCEACGTPVGTGQALPPVPPPPAAKVADEDDDDAPLPAGGAGGCRACGGTVAADGYCEQCGTPAASERDHFALSPAPWVGGVCDRGVRHARNEDAMALAASGSFAALVVCDGVSTAPGSDVASLAAAGAALDVLVAGGPEGSAAVTGADPVRRAAWSALLARAAVAGDDAVAASAPGAEPEHAPSCTFVAAVVDEGLLVVGWLGDSRVYWLPDDGTPEQLTADDSGAGELMARGVPRAAAEASPQAHAITRWLGPDAEDVTARTTATVVDGPGWVLVCSDGLWNYCSPAPDVARLVREHAETTGPDPTALAGALVAWANAQGGRDNVTAALARVG